MENMSIFSLVHSIMQKSGISVILIGGFAVNHYGVSRSTADVDFLITDQDFKAIFPFLKEAGFQEKNRHENFICLENTAKAGVMDVDFMFVDKATFDRMNESGGKTKIEGREFTVPSLEHLIALKLHSIKYNREFRENRDLPDILNLVKRNNIDTLKNEFKEMCLKFGTANLYQEINKKSGDQ